MNATSLMPAPGGKFRFHLSCYRQIPQKPGCYALTTFNNDILYIGLSGNLFERFQQHLSNPEKTNPTDAGRAVWFYFLTYPKEELAKLERTWLNQFESEHAHKPLFNKVDSPIG